jgi:hypothetical protein
MEKEQFKNILNLIIIGFICYILVYLFFRLIAYPNKEFEIDIAVLTAFPTIFVIVATLMYVLITSKILEENQLDRKKSFIGEMIKKILFPLFDRIKRELEDFQDKSIYLVKNQKCDLNHYYLKNFGSHKHADVFYKIFGKNYPELLKKIRRHDNKLPEINESINNLIIKISTKEFWNKWMEKVHYYEKRADRKNFFSVADPRESYIIDSILNSIFLKQKFHDIPIPFWEKYGEEILLEREQIKKELEELDLQSKKMLNFLLNIRDDFENAIISEQEKYGILAYD